MQTRDYNLHYNFVYFNANYNRGYIIDPDEYNAICLRDAESMMDVMVVQTPLQHFPLFFRKLYYIYKSERINKFIKLPQSIWFPFIFKNKFKNDKPFCFVFASTSYPLQYIKYLRNKYPGCKIVKIHRDLLKIAHLNPMYTEEHMNQLFDLRLTFDEGEAKRYGLSHFTEIESKVNIELSASYPICDVFFAGKAKDRLPKLIQAYDLFEKAGYKCDFFITHVPEENQIKRKGITYSNTFMPYKEMLYKAVNSRCMFDINQSGAVGYTSRFLEAIMYNKLFITDNPAVIDTEYFKSGHILYFKNIQDIKPEFIEKKEIINYNYSDAFSPIKLILQIDNELI